MNATEPHRRRRAGGFTLIEIMVVIVIIGLIVGIVAPGIMGQLDRAAIKRAETDIERIGTALDLFRTDFFRYPSTDEGLEILLGGGDINGRTVNEYLNANNVPRDPWDRPYVYENPGTRGDDYDLYTLGADGEEGGDGVDGDIGNWNLR